MQEEIKRAALALFAMHPRDREWILAQLSPERRRTVKPLLDELAALGFTREAIDSHELLELSAARGGAKGADLASATPAQIDLLVERWGGDILPAIWSFGDFAWKRAMLKRLGRKQRTALVQRAESMERRLPPKVRLAMVKLACGDTSSGELGRY